MLRVATSTVARRTVLNSSRGVPSCALPRTVAFHSSSRKEEEMKAPQPGKGGLFGTGLSNWFALPIGIVAAVPILKFEWYVITEETQLAACFIGFCIAVYTQGGDAINKYFDEISQSMLKEHNETEDKVIAALQHQLEVLQADRSMAEDFEAINKIREDTYNNLNAAGAIKPQHDFKFQVERLLNMIAQEEANVTEKTKIALMKEATAYVTEQFSNTKSFKKAALDSAIAQIKGSSKNGGPDPVQTAFVKFFKDKAATASKSDDNSEEKAQREALITKLNALAKNEKYFFEFDPNGQPKMTV